jgi:hypothetical protein
MQQVRGQHQRQLGGRAPASRAARHADRCVREVDDVVCMPFSQPPRHAVLAWRSKGASGCRLWMSNTCGIEQGVLSHRDASARAPVSLRLGLFALCVAPLGLFAPGALVTLENQQLGQLTKAHVAQLKVKPGDFLRFCVVSA